MFDYNRLLSTLSTLPVHGLGIVALAPLEIIPYRTILTGTSSWFDILVLAPGIHNQLSAPDLSGGEWPAVGAMTTGYVFRAENAAIVRWMQDIGRPGCLTNVRVDPPTSASSFSQDHNPVSTAMRWAQEHGLLASSLYALCGVLTVSVTCTLYSLKDISGLLVLFTFILSRTLTTYIIRQRTVMGWKGAPEPGVKGDLLVLLSEDKWFRIRGYVDDLKATVSGGWFRRATQFETMLSGVSSVLVFAGVGLLFGGSTTCCGAVLIVGLFLSSACLLGLSNLNVNGMHLYGRHIKVDGEPKAYARRLVMAEELIKESGRDDWAVVMGMVKPKVQGDAKVAIM